MKESMVIHNQGPVLTALGAGHIITVEYTNEPPSSARKSYRLSSNNKTIAGRLISRMLAAGLIKANGDGFEFGEAQTYVLANAEDAP